MSFLLPASANIALPPAWASSGSFAPWLDPFTLFYWDPDDAATAKLSVITDKTGNHNLNQPAGSKQATNTGSQFGDHKGLVFPAAANHGGYLFDSTWTKPQKGTIYSVLKYTSNGAAQALYNGAVLGVYGVIAEIGPAGQDKGNIIAGSTNAQSAAIVSGSKHLIKFGWDAVALKIYIALDGGATVTGTFDAVNSGGFAEIGLSSLAVKDLISTLGLQAIATGWHDGDQYDHDMTAYFKTWAGIS